MWSCSSKLKGNGLPFDVTFRFQNSSFGCEKSIFESASPLFKHIFIAAESGVPQLSPPGCSVKLSPNGECLTIDLDESSDAFEAIHAYLHDPE